jgi:hypothetical protein
MTDTELRRSIDHAYVVFGGYKLRGIVDVCHCPACLKTDAERRLLATPLRDISSDLLASYSHAAKPIDPDQVSKSLRYFLPRYFELIAAHDWPVHFFEAGALKMLAQAQYRRTWPAHEIAAVDDFFEALFRATLSQPVDLADEFDFLNQHCLIATVLGLVIRADGNVSALLAEWDSTLGATATLHLALLIEHSRTGILKKRRLHWAYEHHNPGAEKMVLAWLLRPATKSRMEAAFLEEKDPVKQAVLSNVKVLLTQLIDR